MSNICGGSVQACAIRVSRLDASGVPAPGSQNLIVASSIIDLEATPEITEGKDMELTNGCGDLCVTFKDRDRLKRLTTTMNICTVDPELTELLIGGTVLTDGDATGYAYPSIGTITGNGVSVELWSKHIVDGVQDTDYPYIWWVLPRTYWQIDARKWENDPMTHPFKGYAVENPNWFDGPANDWPVASGRVLQWLPTDSIPETSCGYQTLAAS